MIIGFLSLDIFFPYCRSLKEKRKRLLSFRDRLKKKYNVAFAELEYHDKWQRTKIGIVTLNNEKKMVEKIFYKVIQDFEDNVEGELLKTEIQFC